MVYKYSKYNIICEEYDDTYLVFNTKTTSLSEVDKGYFQLGDGKKFLSDDLSKNEMDTLLELGIIVPDSVDELEKMKYESICTYGKYDDILFLTIAPTYNCNMKCPYCFQSEKASKMMTREMEEDIFIFLKNIVKKYKHIDVRWFGGEPTLDIELIGRLSEKIIHLCDEHGVIYTSNMVTNGVIIEDDVLAKFIQWKIASFQITMGGRLTHDTERIMKNGKKTYYHLLENINNISKKARVTIRCNVNENNCLDICDMFEDLFATVEQKENLMFLLYPISDFNGDGSKDENYKQYCKKEFFSDAEVVLIKKLLGYVGHEQIDNLHFQPSGLVCMAQTMNKVVVDCNGDIYKCEVAMQKNEHIVANIKELSYCEDVLFNANNSKWMYTIPEESCKECQMFPLCKSGCLAQRFNGNKKKVCALFKKHLKELIKLRYESIQKENRNEK